MQVPPEDSEEEDVSDLVSKKEFDPSSPFENPKSKFLVLCPSRLTALVSFFSSSYFSEKEGVMKWRNCTLLSQIQAYVMQHQAGTSRL